MIKRRTFLASAMAAAATTALPRRSQSAGLAPFKLFDTHAHFYTNQPDKYPFNATGARYGAEKMIAKATAKPMTPQEKLRQEPPRTEERGRVLPFMPRAARSPNDKRLCEQSRSPVPDLSRFQRLPQDEDYGHRMLMNLLAFAVLSVMVLFGVWIADNMSERARGEDCILLGRTSCAPIPVPPG